MKERINAEALCVLKKDNLTNQIKVDYIPIEKPLAKTIEKFSTLCDNPSSTLQQITNFISTTTELDQLTTHYRYCVNLRGAFPAFSANNRATILEINNRQELILFNKKTNPLNYDIHKATRDYKEELKTKYNLWHEAYSINKAYRLCHEDNSILTFSHRIDGWSNPVYQLTPNFSVEIKTNFGYGRASYFYTKLKYKNIEITPFSEWIDYEFAKFSEIVRYTQSHILRNEFWLEAMEFAKNACNLSMTDESKFVEKYIIEECERMVTGLEEMFTKEHFTFKNQENEHYSTDKKGHVLVEFRGEKISGALDFISKILEFEKFASIKTFIKRIEACNKKIQPILIDESKVIKVKISNLTGEKNTLKPHYDKVVSENTEYNKKRSELQKSMLEKGLLEIGNIDFIKFEKEFSLKYPNYVAFKYEYQKITEAFRILSEQIKNLTMVNENIISYHNKITQYFG